MNTDDKLPLEIGRNCWRIERAEKATVIVDAEDYFRISRQAMKSAKHQIMLVGWDFDARIRLVREGEDDAPVTVGEFIDWLIERTPTLQIHLLRWDVGAMKNLFRGRTIFTLMRWAKHPRIHLRLDGHHPTGGSHHQKVVVIDDCIAFCGGIDMTEGRWDTREHLDDDPERIGPTGEPYGPWHDVTTAMSGDVAAALGALCRTRWQLAGGKPLPVPPPTKACWPDGLPVQFTDAEVAISRTHPCVDGDDEVREIEALYCDLIAHAKHWVYAESQYFASRKVAEAIAKRLGEEDGPEFVLVNPTTAEGWLEPIAMDNARARLVEALRQLDKYGRLRLYHPVTAGGEPIYVHAKVTIVDGHVLRVGSSNFNNRSMGLDTECDVTIHAARDGNEDEVDTIHDIAYDLLGEHLGVAAEKVESLHAGGGSLIAAIEELRGEGKTLIPYEVPDVNAVAEWLADNEVLDPEHPDDAFEITERKGLFRRLKAHRPHRPQTKRASFALGAAAAAVIAGGVAVAVSKRGKTDNEQP